MDFNPSRDRSEDEKRPMGRRLTPMNADKKRTAYRRCSEKFSSPWLSG
jgi:hypothetical protein